MLSLTNLKKYIIYTKHNEQTRHFMSSLNENLIGFDRYKLTTYYNDNKYHITMGTNRMIARVAIYGKKYKFMQYRFSYNNRKFCDGTWSTDFYHLSESNPICKILNIDCSDLMVIHKSAYYQKLYYYIQHKNAYKCFYLNLIYDLNDQLEEVSYIPKEGSYLNIKYHNNSIKTICIVDNVDNEKYYVKI
jgi:hypothetical protein